MIEYFKDKCLELGIDPNDCFVFGRGSKKNSKGRFQMQVDSRRIINRMYAIQFCKDREMYIAWNLKRAKIRREYSLDANSIPEPYMGGVIAIGKNVEFSGWNYENVFVFDKEAVGDFLRRVKKSTNPEDIEKQ